MQSGDSTAIWVFAGFLAAGLFGECLTRLTNQIAMRRRAIRITAAGLGSLIGAACFAVIFMQDKTIRVTEAVIALLLISAVVTAASTLILYPIVAFLTLVWLLLAGSTRAVASWSARVRDEHQRLVQQQNADRALAEQSRLAKKEAAEKTAAQKRRENARADCEVLFISHSYDIRERFSREEFDAFVSAHLGDARSPDYVEKLALDLQTIIREHVRKLTTDLVGPSQERNAAKEAVRCFYRENAEFLHETLPPQGFDVKLRVYIPDSATVEHAWIQAEKLIEELRSVVAKQKKPINIPRRHVNPNDLDFS